MALRLCHARHNEKGGIYGGKVGDQTGDEIHISKIEDYENVWTYRCHIANKSVRSYINTFAILVSRLSVAGYSQDSSWKNHSKNGLASRFGLWNQFRNKVKIKDLKKCNCDCATFVGAILCLVGGMLDKKKLFKLDRYVLGSFNTLHMVEDDHGHVGGELGRVGFRVQNISGKSKKWIKGNCVAGDILVRPVKNGKSGHTAFVVDV